ncbi:DUF1376 domain-containing protein [Planctomycetota bacterium]
MNNQPKYVQLEAGAFLSDHEFQAMSAEERGVYCALIFNLYCNGGKCKLDHVKLGRITNCNNFEVVWQNISEKFQVRRGFIYHKRVSRELKTATERMQTAREKAVKAANARWNKDAPSNAQAKHGECDKGKVSEGNVIEDKGNKTTNTDTKDSSSLTTNPVRVRGLIFNTELEKIIRPVNQSDRTCFRNITNWLIEQCGHGKFNEKIFDRVLDYAKEAKNGRNPAAVFMALMKKELGYKPAD